jgi:tetratricopeptide (TPR) repeat protein
VIFNSSPPYVRVCATLWMMLGSLTMLGCAWLAPGAARADIAAGDPAEVLFFKAQAAMAQGDHESAIATLLPASRKSSAPPEILVQLAQAYIGQRELDKALAVLSRAVTDHPDYVPAFELRAVVHRRQGNRALAIEDLESALELAPRNPALIEALGSLRLRNLETWELGPEGSELRRTLELYQRLVEVRSGSEKITPLIILASLYSRVGEHEAAIEYASRASRLRSHDIRAQLTLATVYEEAARPEDALATYRQALLIDPENSVIQGKIATLVEQLGLEGGTLEFYRALAEEFPGVREIQEVYASELIAAERWVEAAELYRGLIARYDDSPELKAGLVRALLAAGREDEAMTIVQSLIQDESVDTQVLLELAEALRSQGRLDDVIALLERARSSGNADLRVALALAQVQVQAGRRGDAVRTLEAIAAESPSLFAVVTLLADIYTEEGRYEDARRALAGLDEETRSRRGAEIRLREANIYRLEGRPEEAAGVLEELLGESDPPSEIALRLLVEIYSETGESAKAMETVERFIASAVGPEQRSARSIKAWLHWRNREFPEAIEILEELHAEDTEDFATLQLLVENYAETGEFDKAEGLMRAAGTTALGEMDDNFLILRARLFHLQNRHAEAAETAEKLLVRQKDNDDYLMIAGEYYYEAGRMEDAERVLRRAIELDPTNAEAYNALGYFFAEAGIKLDEALELVQKALELNPDAGHIVDSLGWVYFMQGRYEEAARDLERAVELLKNRPDPVVLEHLGDAYMKLGREEAAREAWHRALELDPESESVLEKLK